MKKKQIIFKKKDLGIKIYKAKNLKEKEIKKINQYFQEQRIKYKDFIEDISPYIEEMKENSFKTFLMSFEEICKIIFENNTSPDVDSRFSIISDKETNAMSMPEVFEKKEVKEVKKVSKKTKEDDSELW